MKKKGVKNLKSLKKEKLKIPSIRIWQIITLIVLLLLIAILAFVSGNLTGRAIDTFDLRQGSEQIIKGIQDFSEPFLRFIFGVQQYDEYLWTKILLFSLLFVIIYAVLKNVDLFARYPSIPSILSGIVSLLAIRYLISNNLINVVLLQYGALGIAITVFLPYLVYFYFVETSVRGRAGRRLAWILFGLVFIALWISRRNDLGGANWVYIMGIVAVAIAVIFDPQIRGYFGIMENRKSVRAIMDKQKREIKDELRKLTEQLRNRVIKYDEYERETQDLLRNLRTLEKMS